MKKQERENSMSKKNKKVVKFDRTGKTVAKSFSDKEIETWAYYFSGRTQDVESLEIVKEMSERVPNIGDMTALVQFLDNELEAELTSQLSMIVQRMTIMEYIITDKLGISTDDMAEYAKKYEKEMEELRAEMERLAEAEQEEDTEEEEWEENTSENSSDPELEDELNG